MLDMSKLDFDIDTLNAEVAELQRVEGVKETEQELNTQAQARIDAYFLNNRRLIRWGFDSLVYKPVRVNTSNELLTCLTNYQLDGNGQLSGNFLIGAYYVLESRLHSCKVKVNGLVRTNLDKLRQELKFLKGRLKVLKSLRDNVDKTLSVTFLDASLSYSYILDKLIEGLITIIDRGFQFKHTKRYVSLAAEGITGNYQTFYDSVRGLNSMKAGGIYKKATPKLYTRKIRQLMTMPTLGYDKNRKIISYTSYKKKQLPLYLQD